MNDGTTRFTCRGQSIKHNMVIKINYDLKKKKQPANIFIAFSRDVRLSANIPWFTRLTFAR